MTKDEWTGEFRGELERLRPHLDVWSKVALVIANQAYAASAGADPKGAAQRWHAAQQRAATAPPPAAK